MSSRLVLDYIRIFFKTFVGYAYFGRLQNLSRNTNRAVVNGWHSRINFAQVLCRPLALSCFATIFGSILSVPRQGVNILKVAFCVTES